MTVTPVQTVSAATITTATINGVVTGNTLIGVVGTNGGMGGSITSLSDNKGNTYVLVDAGGSGTPEGYQGFYALNVTGGNLTITLNSGGSIVSGAIIVQEFNATDASSFDKHAIGTYTNTGSGGSASSGASPTTTQAAETVYGWVFQLASASAPTVGSGYGNFISKTDGTSLYVAVESKSVTSIGAQTATFVCQAFSSAVAGVMTFKSSASTSRQSLLTCMGMGS
jgi:hypothetical protein